MTRSERTTLALGLSLALIFAMFLTHRLVPVAHANCGTPCTGVYYGAPYQALANAATDGSMPQQENNWCGIADVSFISDYTQTSLNRFGQGDVWSAMDDPNNAVSPWGKAKQHGPYGNQPGPYVFADIAADGGEDPRAQNWAAWYTTPNGYIYHNYIYPGNNWGNGHSPVDNAVRNFASDYGSSGINNPIIILVNSGLHSVIVSGVWASGDPSQNPTTTTLYGVQIWDSYYNSGFGPINYYNGTGTEEDWNISTFETAGKWWGQPYNTGNGYDPDPYTLNGNYYNVPPLSGHWNGNYVTVEQDNIPLNSVPLDVALNNLGSYVSHN